MADNGTLVHILTSNQWGGIERYAFDICRHYRDKGWDVGVLTRAARGVDRRFEEEGIKLFHAPLWGMSDFETVRILGKLLRKSTGDKVIIHAHGFRSTFSALLARKLSHRKDVKVVSTRHRVAPGSDSWLFRKIYKSTDVLLFVSELAKKSFLSTWHERSCPVDEEKMHVIHNSLNIREPIDTPNELTGPVTAMFHGPLKSGKGLETLIDALSLLKDEKFRLRIVGSGKPDYQDILRRRAMARGVMDKIDWHRHVDNPLPFISESHFGVLPSVDEEAFGLANLEYMAVGRPQVASSNGAQPEFITDGREGFLIPPGNPVTLADAMKKLVDDQNLRNRMGERALATFNESLEWTGFISRLSEIYSY